MRAALRVSRMDKFEYENDAAEAEYVLIEETLKKTRSLTDRMVSPLQILYRDWQCLDDDIGHIRSQTSQIGVVNITYTQVDASVDK